MTFFAAQAHLMGRFSPSLLRSERMGVALQGALSGSILSRFNSIEVDCSLRRAPKEFCLLLLHCPISRSDG